MDADVVLDPPSFPLSVREQTAIWRAALAEHMGDPGQAEASRWAADYHNLGSRADADLVATVTMV